MNSQTPKSEVSPTWALACRPTLLFVAAYALNVTPHEIVHALTSYALGFNSTVFQMWVNPGSAEASPSQLAIIAVSGPLFSLLVGVVYTTSRKKLLLHSLRPHPCDCHNSNGQTNGAWHSPGPLNLFKLPIDSSKRGALSPRSAEC
jgi:hypothetical protein